MIRLSARQRTAVELVVSGAYAPSDLREFVRLCYILARPLICSKIRYGKINIAASGLRESDVIYDCLADIFERDHRGNFVRLETIFSSNQVDVTTLPDEELVATLSCLVIGQVNKNIVRLYSEADSSLAKILRNLKIALERERLFQPIVRFGEVYLVPVAMDHLFHKPPLPIDVIKQELSGIVCVHDNVREMLKKLHRVVSVQTEYQRAVSMIGSALLFKDVYTLAWNIEHQSTDSVQEALLVDDVLRVAERVCEEIRREYSRSYVDTGKCSAEVFDAYLCAVAEVLRAKCDSSVDRRCYYDCLKTRFPQLSRNEYMRKHRPIVEYLGTIARNRLSDQLKADSAE